MQIQSNTDSVNSEWQRKQAGSVPSVGELLFKFEDAIGKNLAVSSEILQTGIAAVRNAILSSLPPAQTAPRNNGDISAIISDFVEHYSYADMAHVELNDSMRNLLHDAISTLVERDEFVEAMESDVAKKWESDKRLMHGFAQILKENDLMPSGSELIAASKRFGQPPQAEGRGEGWPTVETSRQDFEKAMLANGFFSLPDNWNGQAGVYTNHKHQSMWVAWQAAFPVVSDACLAAHRREVEALKGHINTIEAINAELDPEVNRSRIRIMEAEARVRELEGALEQAEDCLRSENLTTAQLQRSVDGMKGEMKSLKTERDAALSAKEQERKEVLIWQDRLVSTQRELHALQQRLSQGWVKCSERMPTKEDASERGFVLWRWTDGMETARYDYPFDSNKPTYWMSIPPLPAPSEQENHFEAWAQDVGLLKSQPAWAIAKRAWGAATQAKSSCDTTSAEVAS